jgi:DNA-binding NtrC family response regulator
VQEALELLSSQTLDVILLDLKLPGISGLEVLRTLKTEKRPERILIISAHGTIETAVQAMKLGAADFIEKPFTPDDIRQLVNKHLLRAE